MSVKNLSVDTEFYIWMKYENIYIYPEKSGVRNELCLKYYHFPFVNDNFYEMIVSV